MENNALWKIKALVEWEEDNAFEELEVSATSFEEAVKKAKAYYRRFYRTMGSKITINIESIVRDRFLDA